MTQQRKRTRQRSLHGKLEQEEEEEEARISGWLSLCSHLAQAWEHYGPGAMCSHLSFFIQPAELEEILSIESKYDSK